MDGLSPEGQGHTMARKAKPVELDTSDDGAAPSPPPASSAAAPDGTRAMFTLSAHALKLVDTAVLVDGMGRSAVVEALIVTHLAPYFSGKRSGPSVVTAEG